MLWPLKWQMFLLAIGFTSYHFFYSSERAVRLGDAPTFNSVKRGVGPQGRSEVRFLTFSANI